ncbi:glucans biosynthesis glucosyltransferase MdoH [Rhodobacter sp. Har01]|uniref:glucans biosynthesis glucosyltransferase MdoH n=1 Tax=Rhodobacter sp. Har01 TaxID=2883999 RepID=UPI001D06D4A2|nr:glucans biosynthesis glucosyltransferase MdoH [Rhodobacter sp. Har01]MCB6176768.1 glucans biosynthesis glucosyltransferase MdoH [Rhodobacter sp. Har01]
MTQILRPLTGFQPVGQPASLAMPDQRLDLPFHDPAAPATGPRRTHARRVRVAVLGLPPLVALAFGLATAHVLAFDGRLAVTDVALAALSGFAIYWLALSTVTAAIGLFRRPRPQAHAAAPGLRIAILLPMYGEDPGDTISRATDLLAALKGPGHAHRFSLHVLSDTRDSAAVLAEAATVAALSEAHPGLFIRYRHRLKNRDYKQGNIRDWIMRQGSAYDAALILDADSKMGRRTVLTLADALVADPGCALVQTLAMVAPGDTVWQRLQSFASRVYGGPLGRGYAAWTGSDGNFMGHNAIVRIRAFATCTGLPHLSGPRPLGGVILSHDFVEAALLRRAGWGVRILPEAADSHEDAPGSLVGHIRRDARWCQGNLQHLRLIRTPGLTAVSRFHLFSGAMAYLGAVVWASILTLWAVAGSQEVWFVLGGDSGAGWLMATVLTLLFAPKLMGIADHIARVGVPRGRRLGFAGMVLAETAVSTLVAPVMMVQHLKIIGRALAGVDTGWPQHGHGRIPLRELARFHAAETALGVALLAAMGFGVLSLWALPLGLGLVLAVPVSALAGLDGSRLPQAATGRLR